MSRRTVHRHVLTARPVLRTRTRQTRIQVRVAAPQVPTRTRIPPARGPVHAGDVNRGGPALAMAIGAQSLGEHLY
jgi:hypothetical protein